LKSLTYYREGAYTDAEILEEFNEIKADTDSYRDVARESWTIFFTRRDLFARLWRAALLQFMAQMCGATAIKYYLPSLFKKLGIETQLALMISGIESTLKIPCTIIEMYAIDRLGRRFTMIGGTILMSIAMLVS
jgi:Sugar (and other) transporter